MLNIVKAAHAICYIGNCRPLHFVSSTPSETVAGASQLNRWSLAAHGQFDVTVQFQCEQMCRKIGAS